MSINPSIEIKQYDKAFTKEESSILLNFILNNFHDYMEGNNNFKNTGVFFVDDKGIAVEVDNESLSENMKKPYLSLEEHFGIISETVCSKRYQSFLEKLSGFDARINNLFESYEPKGNCAKCRLNMEGYK